MDLIATRLSAPQWRLDRNASAFTANTDQGLLLAKSKVLMNISGHPAQRLSRSNAEGNLIVIHDDMQRPLGAVSSRLGGSANGHNGLKSIMSSSRQPFQRIRVGIGRPDNDDRSSQVVSNFVLGDLRPAEIEALQGPVFDKVIKELENITKLDL